MKRTFFITGNYLIAVVSMLAGLSTQPVNAGQAGLAGQQCPTYQYVSGFDANGNLNCAPISTCGGTKPYATVLSTAAYNVSVLGLACGQADGFAKQCVSCSAQWMFPPNSQIITCSCL